MYFSAWFISQVPNEKLFKKAEENNKKIGVSVRYIYILWLTKS